MDMDMDMDMDSINININISRFDIWIDTTQTIRKYPDLVGYIIKHC